MSDDLHGHFLTAVAFEPFVQFELHNREYHEGLGIFQVGLKLVGQDAVSQPFYPSTCIDQDHQQRSVPSLLFG